MYHRIGFGSQCLCTSLLLIYKQDLGIIFSVLVQLCYLIGKICDVGSIVTIVLGFSFYVPPNRFW